MLPRSPCRLCAAFRSAAAVALASLVGRAVHVQVDGPPVGEVQNGGKNGDGEVKDLVLTECTFQKKPKDRMGLSGAHDWLPVSFEIEMFANEDSETFSSAKEKLEENILTNVKTDGHCDNKLFTVHEQSDTNAWMFEMEKDEKHNLGLPLMFEASSPIGLEEDEAEVAIAQSRGLEEYFSKRPPPMEDKASKKFTGKMTGKDNKVPLPYHEDPPGLHVHVLGKCLLKDVHRLVALLLIWERFDEAIYSAVGSSLHTGKASLKAAPIEDKSAELLKHLLKYINDDGWTKPDGDESLVDVFRRLGKSENLKGDKTDADGWRRFEVNICHLLNIKCAHGLQEKNRVPKFGGVEYRGFDPMVGEELRLVVTLVQRLTQFACSADKDRKGKGSLHKLANWDGETEEESTKDLLEALDLKPKDYSRESFMSAKFSTGPS